MQAKIYFYDLYYFLNVYGVNKDLTSSTQVKKKFNISLVLISHFTMCINLKGNQRKSSNLFPHIRKFFEFCMDSSFGLDLRSLINFNVGMSFWQFCHIISMIYWNRKLMKMEYKSKSEFDFAHIKIHNFHKLQTWQYQPLSKLNDVIPVITQASFLGDEGEI